MYERHENETFCILFYLPWQEERTSVPTQTPFYVHRGKNIQANKQSKAKLTMDVGFR